MMGESLPGYDSWRTQEPDLGPEPIPGEFVVTFTVGIDAILPADQDEDSWAQQRRSDAYELMVAIQELILSRSDKLPVEIGMVDCYDPLITNA